MLKVKIRDDNLHAQIGRQLEVKIGELKQRDDEDEKAYEQRLRTTTTFGTAFVGEVVQKGFKLTDDVAVALATFMSQEKKEPQVVAWVKKGGVFKGSDLNTGFFALGTPEELENDAELLVDRAKYLVYVWQRTKWTEAEKAPLDGAWAQIDEFEKQIHESVQLIGGLRRRDRNIPDPMEVEEVYDAYLRYAHRNEFKFR
jgi:hypothetical protein